MSIPNKITRQEAVTLAEAAEREVDIDKHVVLINQAIRSAAIEGRRYLRVSDAFTLKIPTEEEFSALERYYTHADLGFDWVTTNDRTYPFERAYYAQCLITW